MSEQPDGQSEGRENNAAARDYPEVSEVTPESYPAVDQHDAVERTGRGEQVAGEPRGFDNSTGNPQPRQGAGDTSEPAARQDGFSGEGDPAEGKR